MTYGLLVEPVWHDTDLIEIRVQASNGRFSGSACLYEDLEALQTAATTLAGFPALQNDRRTIAWGDPDPDRRLGAASLEFIADLVGHCIVRIELKTGDNCADIPGESVKMLLPTEAAAVDRFVEQLRTAGLERQGIAILDGCGPTMR